MKNSIVALLVVVGITGIAFLMRVKFDSLQPVEEAQEPALEESIDRVAEEFEENTENTGADVASVLNVPEGYVVSVYADGFAKPRAFDFDALGKMVVADLEENRIFAVIKDDEGVMQKKDLLGFVDFPNSLVFYENALYVALKDGVYKYDYDAQKTEASNGQRVYQVPVKAGIRHQTRTVAFNDGQMYISVGSTCDACLEDDERYATIIRANPDGSEAEIFARGLRNTVFFTFDKKGNLWGNDMGQDNLGDDLPPDELNMIQEGEHHGWPYCYGPRINNGFDARYDCGSTASATHLYSAHVAPLGLLSIDSNMFERSWQGDFLSAMHGSWNREQPAGYSVKRLVVSGGKIQKEEVFIDGWLNHIPGENSAKTSHGRPVFLAFGPDESLYISDDLAGVILRVSKE